MTKPLPLWSRNFEASSNINPEVENALSAAAGIALTFSEEMVEFLYSRHLNLDELQAAMRDFTCCRYGWWIPKRGRKRLLRDKWNELDKEAASAEGAFHIGTLVMRWHLWRWVQVRLTFEDKHGYTLFLGSGCDRKRLPANLPRNLIEDFSFDH